MGNQVLTPSTAAVTVGLGTMAMACAVAAITDAQASRVALSAAAGSQYMSTSYVVPSGGFQVARLISDPFGGRYLPEGRADGRAIVRKLVYVKTQRPLATVGFRA